MVYFKVQITAFLDDWQPGWVECKFKDAYDCEVIIHEKVPVVSSEWLNKSSDYPTKGKIGCIVVNRYVDGEGQEIIKISTSTPWGIESIDGRNEFDLLPEQLFESND
jgi:hypothetical protein